MKIVIDLVNWLYPFLIGMAVGASLANIAFALLDSRKKEVKDE